MWWRAARNNITANPSVCVHPLSLVRLFETPVDCSLPGSSVHGIFQARILEWVGFPPPGDIPKPGIELLFPGSPALADGFFTTETPGKPMLLVSSLYLALGTKDFLLCFF